MKLLGVRKEDSWLYSEWNLTYRVGWDHICRAAELIYRYTEDPEILVGDSYQEEKAEVKEPEEILSLEENGYLTIRGMSELIRVPLMITFYNQLDLVRLSVASVTEEFEEADYKAFNLSLCQFMDSVEIAMYG